MSAKFRYAHPDRETCTRCHQAAMRVVLTRTVAGIEKEQLTCSNPQCDHSIIRNKPTESWHLADDHGEEGAD